MAGGIEDPARCSAKLLLIVGDQHLHAEQDAACEAAQRSHAEGWMGAVAADAAANGILREKV